MFFKHGVLLVYHEDYEFQRPKKTLYTGEAMTHTHTHAHTHTHTSKAEHQTDNYTVSQKN